MRDGRPNPDIWGNIITCGEIAVGIYEIVGTKKRGLEIPKAVAEEILPESVMEQATQDGEALCFTDPVSNAIVADALLEQELVIDPKAAAQLEAIRQLDDVSYDTGFEPSISDVDKLRLVYISSPLRGDVERNIQRARDYCAYAASCGVIPLAPHTIFTQYLDDEQPEQREQGLRMGRDLMWRCDDLWVVGSTISSGMREEIELAKKLYMPIFYVPEDMVQEKVKIRQQDHLLRLDDCIEGSSKSSYEGQILVLKPEAYGSSMDLTADDSLWYARDGFGCIYGARGQAVYAENLLDGRYIHWERKDFYGIVKPESLAAWIADKPIRSEAAEAVLEAAVQNLAPELEDWEELEP